MIKWALAEWELKLGFKHSRAGIKFGDFGPASTGDVNG